MGNQTDDMKDAAKRMDDALASLGLEKIEPQRPDEFTIEELRTHMGADSEAGGRQLIERRLKAGIKEGTWTRRKLGKCYVYRRK